MCRGDERYNPRAYREYMNAVRMKWYLIFRTKCSEQRQTTESVWINKLCRFSDSWKRFDNLFDNDKACD